MNIHLFLILTRFLPISPTQGDETGREEEDIPMIAGGSIELVSTLIVFLVYPVVPGIFIDYLLLHVNEISFIILGFAT